MKHDYKSWIAEVQQALQSINMSFDDWQNVWYFDFLAEYDSGTESAKAAEKANRYWWHQQNMSLHQECLRIPGCWLPRKHQGECQLV
jgi:hypothetical protein